MSACELCSAPAGGILFEDPRLRVVAVSEALHPGFCRVIWRDHVREMTDLAQADREHLMTVVFATEAAMRATLPAHKINLASLGNLTPHLHWHVIARFADDPHFPDPVWAVARHQTPIVLPVDWLAQMQRALGRFLSAGVS